MIRLGSKFSSREEEACSTPEGIETVISLETCFFDALEIACSTPEGIETVIRRRSDVARVSLNVLNARRHRDGDQPKRSVASGSTLRCSTPEGIETVIRLWRPQATRTPCGAQPEGIETVISGYLPENFAQGSKCSTPEGIETVISCPAPRRPRQAGGAQRPKASRR